MLKNYAPLYSLNECTEKVWRDTYQTPLSLGRRVELMGRGKAKNMKGRQNFYSISSVLFKFFTINMYFHLHY